MTKDPSGAWEHFLESYPWARHWWRPAPGEGKTFFWIVLIHLTALVGLWLTPIPSAPIFLAALALTWLGGIGTTVCYHRSLAHKSVKLHPIVRDVLTFFAVLNGSGPPVSWVASHRLHHAKSDTVEDISSPRIGGFWWAHLRWIYQVGNSPAKRYCPDMTTFAYRMWTSIQPVMLAVSYLGGLAFGLEGFFWLGSIRLVFALHGQCFVNSICHMRKDARLGADSSRNVPWLAAWHLLQGENWHRNHHDRPGSARLGWTPAQVDVGWMVILLLEMLGLARDVRRPGSERAWAEAPVSRADVSRGDARLVEEAGVGMMPASAED